MFNKELQIQINYQNSEIEELKERYWQLQKNYDRLLKHLNLKEVTIPEKTIYEDATDEPNTAC